MAIVVDGILYRSAVFFWLSEPEISGIYVFPHRPLQICASNGGRGGMGEWVPAKKVGGVVDQVTPSFKRIALSGNHVRLPE